jgi:small basic protein (TIGR04137 family)
MSIHPSLSISEKDKKQRSVLKRSERIRTMMEKGKWNKGDSVFGLPKIKTVRIKIKKEKAEKTETAVVEGAAVAATATGTTEQAATAKKSTSGAQEKK